MGTPLYNREELIPEILEWIAEGKTLREFCRQPEKPSYGSVYDWLEQDKDFASRFARAREQGEEVIAQECLSIADDGSNDWMERTGKDGESLGWQVNGEHVQRSRLRVDTRLKLLAKWNPKKYGDKVTHAGDADNPINMGLQIISSVPRPKQGE